jgi:hypothetical protein
VVAFRNMKLEAPENLEEARKINPEAGTVSIDAYSQTNSLK